jgi:hypothetical protein
MSATPRWGATEYPYSGRGTREMIYEEYLSTLKRSHIIDTLFEEISTHSDTFSENGIRFRSGELGTPREFPKKKIVIENRSHMSTKETDESDDN